MLDQLGAHAVFPRFEAFGLCGFDDGEALFGQGLGGLAVGAVGGHLPELVQDATVEVDEGGAGGRVGVEARQAGGSAGLKEAGQQPCGRPHWEGCGSAIGSLEWRAWSFEFGDD